MDGQRGVTLIELLVTLSLMAILTAIAIPVYMQQLPSIRLKTAARRMASVLSLSRMVAVANNTPCRVVFVPGSSPYYYAFLDSNLNGAVNPGEAAATRLDLQPVAPGIDGVPLPAAVSFGAPAGVTGVPPLTGTAIPTDGVELPSNTVSFDARGTANAMNNNETIYLTNIKGECMAVRVTYSGMTQVYQWGGGGWK
jgi:prepilin-type N-terminal cleavage/methylation domain-containing protein